MSENDLKLLIAMITSITALLVALMGFFKNNIINNQRRETVLNVYKDSKKERSIEKIGDLIRELRNLSSRLKRVFRPVDMLEINKVREYISDSCEKIENIFNELAGLGFINPKDKETVHIYEELHKSKNVAVTACVDFNEILKKEKVRNVVDCTDETFAVANQLYEQVKKEENRVSSSLLQAMAKFGRSE